MNIYALSSGRGPSGIAIIRLSGKDTLKIAQLISKEKNIKSREVNLLKFYDPSTNNLIDEGLLLFFQSPNSYTGDDLAEFHIHGSNAVITLFLDVLSKQANCRMAEPGEFTKIAFQNNKIDLLEAESIGDLIHSETELQRQQALRFIQGNASNYYNSLRDKLIKSLAYIEAKIDFAEDDIPDAVLKDVHTDIKEIYKEILLPGNLLFWKFLLFFGLDHIYKTWWFLTLLFLFGTCLVCCTFTQQFPTLRLARRRNFKTTLSSFKKQEYYISQVAQLTHFRFRNNSYFVLY